MTDIDTSVTTDYWIIARNCGGGDVYDRWWSGDFINDWEGWTDKKNKAKLYTDCSEASVAAMEETGTSLQFGVQSDIISVAFTHEDTELMSLFYGDLADGQIDEN